MDPSKLLESTISLLHGPIFLSFVVVVFQMSDNAISDPSDAAMYWPGEANSEHLL